MEGGWSTRSAHCSPQYTRLIQDAVVSDAAGLGGPSSPSVQQRVAAEACCSPGHRGAAAGRRPKDPTPPPRHNGRSPGWEGDQREGHKPARRASKESSQKQTPDQAAGRAKHTSFHSATGYEVQRALLGRLPDSVRWFVPAATLALGLFAQNAGLYMGTRSYVKWMDELQRPSPSGEVARDSGRTAVLLDIGTALSFPGRSLEELTFVLDVVTCLVPLVWLCWVIRTRDIRLWTQVLLSCALLAVLKGFMAWSTVMPDAEGWEACRERLEKDGLKYYRRQLFGSSSSLDEREIDLPEALLDILLLEVRGLWLLGAEQRGRFCGDSLFNGALCHATLFSLSLWEAIRASTQALQARARFAVRTAVRCLLGAVLLGNAVLPVLNRYHYSADVVLALVLALLTYSNPVIALLVQRWSRGNAEAVRDDPLQWSPRDTRVGEAHPPGSRGSGPPPELPPPGLEELPEEEGRVPLSHLFLGPPTVAHDGCVFLRRGAVQLPTEDIGPELRRLQLEHLRGTKAQLLRCRRLKEEQIVQVQAEAETRSSQAAEEARQRLDERLEEQVRELEAEERRLLAEASGRPIEDLPGVSEQATTGASAARCTTGCLA